MFKSISVNLSDKKKDVIAKQALPSRLQKYSTNLSQYIDINIQEKAARASTSKRFDFFNRLKKLKVLSMGGDKPSTESAQAAFMSLVMILANGDVLDLDLDALQTVENIVALIAEATNFEVDSLGTNPAENECRGSDNLIVHF